MNKITDKIQSINNSPAKNKQKAAVGRNNQFKLLRKAFAAVILFISAWWLLSAAFDAKTKIDDQYHQQLKADAKIELNNILKQTVSALQQQIKKFKAVINDDKNLAMFSKASQHDALITKLKAVFDGSITLQIVSADYAVDEIIANPDLGYSALFLLNELKKVKNDPSTQLLRAQLLKIEVHQLENKNSKLLLVRKVVRNNITIAYIVANLSTDFFSSLTKDYNAQKGYLEITQRYSSTSLMLMKKGDASLRAMPVSVSEKMKEAPWFFRFWTAEQKNEAPILIFYLSFIYVALAILAIVSAIVLLISSLRQYQKINEADVSAVTHDPYNENEQEGFLTELQKKTGLEENQPVSSKTHTLNKNVVDKEAERLIQIADTIFRAYDIRGEVDEYINIKIVYRIAKAIAREMSELGQSKIAIACDARISSPELIKVAINALLECGIKVLDIGSVSSPILYFAALTKADGNGIMITAGHNPANYNGIKIMLSGHACTMSDLQRLKKNFLHEKSVDEKSVDGDDEKEAIDIDMSSSTGDADKIELDVIEEYISKITGDVKLSRPMKIVLDTANAISGKFSSTLFERLNCEVIILNQAIDGNFPAHDPDPGRPENMQELVEKVIEVKADMGIAFDGDGTGLGIISSEGEIIWPDRVLMLLAKDMLSRNEAATILFDVKSTAALVNYINQLGGEALMCKSGYPFIENKLVETGALLAGEMSGHIFFKDRWFGFDDAAYSAARILEILSLDLRKSSQIFAELPSSLNTPEILIETKDRAMIMDKIFQQLRSSKDSFGDGKIITIDGIRVEYSDGWGLVRASNTSNNLTLRFEADNVEAIQRIAGYFKNVLQTVAAELKIPF